MEWGWAIKLTIIKIIMDKGIKNKKLVKLRENLRTESAYMQYIQEGMISEIAKVVQHLGIGGQFVKARLKAYDKKGKSWHWEVIFQWSNGAQDAYFLQFYAPKYIKQFFTRETAVVNDRTPEEAINLSISNKTPNTIEREVSKEVTVAIGEVKNTQQEIGWDVSASVEATGGYAASSATGGPFGSVTAKVSVGLNGRKSTGNEKSDSKTTSRKVSDVIMIPPMSQVTATGTYDKIKLTQAYRVFGVVDFGMYIRGFERIRTDAGKHQTDKYIKNSVDAFKFESVYDFVRVFVGLGGSAGDYSKSIRQDAFDLLDFPDHIIDSLDKLYADDLRKISFTGILEYDDASDVSLSVIKNGDFVLKDQTGGGKNYELTNVVLS